MAQSIAFPIRRRRGEWACTWCLAIGLPALACSLPARSLASMGRMAHHLFEHHSNELLIIDLAITVDVSLAHHLVDLFRGQLLSQVVHDLSQLLG